MILLDQMAKTGRLYEFISAVVRIRNEEQEEKVMWEYWLHKDFERSYPEFLNAAGRNSTTQAEPETTSKQELTEIVKQSMKIASFVPQEE